MTIRSISRLVKVAFVFIGLAVLLPGCKTIGSTSDHVNGKLREHGI